MKLPARHLERYLLIAVSAWVILLSLVYLSRLTPQLDQTEAGYQSDSSIVINLSKTLDTGRFGHWLRKEFDFPDQQYPHLVTEWLSTTLAKRELSNLGSLNRRNFQVPVEKLLAEGGKWGKDRVWADRYEMGWDEDLWQSEQTNPQSYPSTVTIDPNVKGISFSGQVKLAKDNKQGHSSKVLSGVLVVLQEEHSQRYQDSLRNKIIDQTSENALIHLDLDQAIQATQFYARTDKRGRFKFEGLKEGHNYSVSPLATDLSFGSRKGAAAVHPAKGLAKIKRWLKKDYVFNFTGKEHRLPLFDFSLYQQIKESKALTVRSPVQFKNTFYSSIAMFLLGFWLFHLMLSVRKNEGDPILLPVLMFLSGTGLMILFGIQDPLTDNVYGQSMSTYLFLIFLFLSLLVRFFAPIKVFELLSTDYREVLKRKNIRLPAVLQRLNDEELNSRGYLWLFISMSLMILLLFFGSGPEGSGVKVNLGPIQVSEWAKFFMILFFAKYFTANLSYFKKIPDNRWLLRHNFKMLLFFSFLLGIYMLLGDLGPALIVCILFIIFYAFAKNEFASMLLVTLGYGLLLYIVYHWSQGNAGIMALFSMVVCLGLLIVTFFIRKKGESSFFMAMVISAFSILEVIPISAFQRLKERNGMFHDHWYNALYGGDQIAQGIWTLASGGWLGRGLGKGHPNVMPAYHTDMMFQSIGEELGLLSLLLILFAFALLIIRSMRAARNSGKALTFYFMGGVAIATMIQLSIIVGGSLGLLPLTGVSVPFLSKGNSGLLINLLFFGLVIFLSHLKGSKREMEFIRKKFDLVGSYSILTFLGILLLFVGRLFYLQWHADENQIRSALVLDKQGDWQYSINPRIRLIGKQLKAGNVYDRQGRLLATDSKQHFLKEGHQVGKLDPVLLQDWQQQKYGIRRRYYPYGSRYALWTGNLDNFLVTNEQMGYVADIRHYSDLRGIHTPVTYEEHQSEHFREQPFLPETTLSSVLINYDYRAYLPFLKAGTNSSLIEQHNAKERSIYLSLDVALADEINQLLNKGDFQKHPVSVVALKTDDGEVLATAGRPQPNYDDLTKIKSFSQSYYNKLMNSFFGYQHYVADRDLALFKATVPGSTIKILDAVALYNRLGATAASTTEYIDPREQFRRDEIVGRSINLGEAIVNSNNVYFIKLVNDYHLHPELFDLYHAVGISLYHQGGYFLESPKNYDTSYIDNFWLKQLNVGREQYHNPKLKGDKKRLKVADYSYIAWGQGPVQATPLQMARIIGAIANKGTLMPLQFIHEAKGIQAKTQGKTQQILKSNYAHELSGFMKQQSASVSARAGLTLYGKTGSPERLQIKNRVAGRTHFQKVTDAWYVFYVPSSKYKAPLSFAIRIEGKGGSKLATNLAVDLMKQLQAKGYL